MKQWAASAGGVALWAGLTALAFAQAPAAGQGIYTCVDKHGRRITADRPIQECLDREQRELSPSGITRRQIGPSLSDTERAARSQRERRDGEEPAPRSVPGDRAPRWPGGEPPYPVHELPNLSIKLQ